jgi:hypothetical protein
MAYRKYEQGEHMGQLLRRIAKLLGILTPTTYSYPALDIILPGERHFRLCRIKSLSGNMLFFYDVTCPCL